MKEDKLQLFIYIGKKKENRKNARIESFRCCSQLTPIMAPQFNVSPPFRRKRMPNANQIVFIFIFLHEGGPAMCDLILCDQTGTCNMWPSYRYMWRLDRHFPTVTVPLDRGTLFPQIWMGHRLIFMLDLQDDFLHFNHLISNIASEKLMSPVLRINLQLKIITKHHTR